MNYLRQVYSSDIPYLASNLRYQDVREVEAAGKTPLEAITTGASSLYVRTLLEPERGRPVGIFGADWNDAPIASIWMLGTKEIEKYPMTFLRNCRSAIEEVHKVSGKDALWNYTFADNDLHHRWLRWCGAIFLSKTPRGVNGEYFYEFIIMREHLNV